MKINVYSLDKAEQIANGGNWISIRDIGFEHLYKAIDENADNILKLYFDDVSPYSVSHGMIYPFYEEQFKKRCPVYFDDGMASDIYEWALGKDEINIHCFAGISRSQSIAHVINVFFNCLCGKEDDFIRNIPDFSMVNPYVFNIMMNVFKKRICG